MDSASELLNWILGGFSSLLAVLSKVIHGMYQQEQKRNAEAIKDLQDRLAESDRKHEQCEEDRGSLSIKSAILEERIAAIEDAVRK